MTKNTIISIAYWIGFGAICSFILPVIRFARDQGMNLHLILFIAFLVDCAMDN